MSAKPPLAAEDGHHATLPVELDLDTAPAVRSSAT
jgi:hypothetical protein